MSLRKKVKRLFCRHTYHDSRLVSYTADNGDVLLYNKCIKCGKPILIRLDGVSLDKMIEEDMQALKEKREGE